MQRHAEALVLEDVKFVVRPGGRERVLRERKRAVHAFARGRPVENCSERGPCAVRVSYNPYQAGHFFVKDTGEPVLTAKRAYLTSNQELWVDL